MEEPVNERVELDVVDLSDFLVYLKEKKNYKDSSAYVIHKMAESLSVKRVDFSDVTELNNIIIERGIKKRNNLIYHTIKNVVEFLPLEKKVKAEILTELIKTRTYNDRKKLSRNLTDEEIIDVVNHMKEQKHKVIALMQNLTGARVGDIMHLKLEDVTPDDIEKDFVLKFNTLSKGGKRNILFIFDDVAQVLFTNYALSDRPNTFQGYIFIDRLRDMAKHKMAIVDHLAYKVNYDLYVADLKEALVMCGIEKKDFSSHDLRRCFARRVWEKYKDVNVLKMLLHHSDVKTSMRYLQGSGMDSDQYYKDMQS
jgi:integrase